MRIIALVVYTIIAAITYGQTISPRPLTPQPILLRSRTFTPPPGVDPATRTRMARAAATGVASIHLILQLREIPTRSSWERLSAAGIVQVSHLGANNWIVRMPSTLRFRVVLADVLRNSGATALTPLLPSDKASPRVASGKFEEWAFDRASGLLKVVVLFFPDASSATRNTLIRRAHRGREAASARAPRLWAIRIRPADLPILLESEAVHDVDLGPMPPVPLLDDARWNTGAEQLQRLDVTSAAALHAQGLSGKNVRIHLGEEFFDSDDFWNHDVTGARTTNRATECKLDCPYIHHGTMTAGIALGNGFLSSSRGGAAYQWRGFAPDALLDCDEDIVSRSYMYWGDGNYNSWMQSMDEEIREGNLRPQVYAIANNGIVVNNGHGQERGYYSAYVSAKNSIGVANVSASTFRWMFSSLGPTFDGRLKPDLSAPGQKELWPEDKPQVTWDIDYVRLAGSNPIQWDFDGQNWQAGWGARGWWDFHGIGPVTRVSVDGVSAMSFPVVSGPYDNSKSWSRRPMIGTHLEPALTGTASDSVEFRYRMENVPMWQPVPATFQWAINGTRDLQQIVPFDLMADGAWHTVKLPLGNYPRWRMSGITEVWLQLDGPRGMLSPVLADDYSGASGSSSAAPAVSGSLALLMEQMVKKFDIQLGNRTALSPFWLTEWGPPAPGKGVPLSSTFKALLIQGARDLAYLPHADEPDNPDTKAKTVYHDGPDFVTGYGIIDVAESSRIVDAHSAAHPTILERSLTAGTHTYTIDVPASPRAPLRVTLVWDDKAADVLWDQTAPHLVNNIDLSLLSPSGMTVDPYSMDQPFTPAAASFNDPEPEPIDPAGVHPARQDGPNRLDNVEQVFVPNPEPGTWTVRVHAYQLYFAPQKYSLILPAPPKPATHLAGGKVVFRSERATPAQLFVTQVGSGSAKQLTDGFFPARHPRWSPNGKYVAYVTKYIIVGGPSGQIDVLNIIDEANNLLLTVPGPRIGGEFGYPQWSDDGRRIVVTYWSSWPSRGLAILDFGAPYNFNAQPEIKRVLPAGSTPSPGEAIFSRDGQFIYFMADGTRVAEVFRMPAEGGAPRPVYGNGAPITRAFAPSLSPDGTRLVYNSELWRDDPVRYQDEEILEVGFLEGVIRRVTAEPGNQYGWFARNGTGEMVLQSNTTPSGKTALYLEENGTRVSLPVGGSAGVSDSSPDWWKPPCAGGTVLWANGEAVGCKFATWGPDQKSVCGAWKPVPTSGNGSCAVCIEASRVNAVLGGTWMGLTEGATVATAVPADLSCRACVRVPASLAGWWPFDETPGTPAASPVGNPQRVVGRVRNAVRLNGTSHLEVPHTPSLNLGTADLTIDAWVKVDSAADLQGIHVIVEKRQALPWRGYSFFLIDGNLGLQLADGSGSQYSNYFGSRSVPADGAWHLVAVTVTRANAQGGQFYLDGEPAGTFNPTAQKGTLDNSRPLRIGSVTHEGAGSRFRGSLDEIEIFRRALTPWEMKMLFAAGACGKCQ